jgi:hypothetical protein
MTWKPGVPGQLPDGFWKAFQDVSDKAAENFPEFTILLLCATVVICATICVAGYVVVQVWKQKIKYGFHEKKMNAKNQLKRVSPPRKKAPNKTSRRRR